MKLTIEEREKYRKEFAKEFSFNEEEPIVNDTTEYWLSKIDTILEEREKDYAELKEKAWKYDSLCK